jgi:ABC-2 type transport system ATP-binding protein
VHAGLWGLSNDDAQRRIGDVVDAFGLGEFIDRPVDTYSGGQRRRLEIARALLSEPEVLFLDEPTVGLDPRVRHELLDLIAGLRSRSGVTILLTTHYLDEAEELSDRVAILHDGQIVALHSPSALLAEIGRAVLELRIDGDGEAVLRALQSRGLGTKGMFAVGSTVYIPLNGDSGPDIADTVTDLGFATKATSSRRPTLDDVYLQLTGNSLAK